MIGGDSQLDPSATFKKSANAIDPTLTQEERHRLIKERRDKRREDQLKREKEAEEKKKRDADEKRQEARKARLNSTVTVPRKPK